MPAIRFLLAVMAGALLASATPAQTLPELQGPTVAGKPFTLSQLRGKVVMLMFWSTSCAVCRDKMPELRQNHEGWRGQPFELVLVSVDPHLSDLQAYENILRQLVPARQRFTQLWAGDPSYRDSLGKPPVLPLTYLINKAGQVVGRYPGRIPAQAWDQIADLL